MSDAAPTPPFPPGSEVFVRFASVESEGFRQYLAEGGFRSGLVRWYGARFIFGTILDCQKSDGAGLVTRATFTGRSRLGRDGGTVWEFLPIEPVDIPRSALASPRADSPAGFDRAPTRYMAKGRETVDRMRDAAHALADSLYDGVPGARAEDADQLARMMFIYACETHALKYEDRLGRKDGVDPARDQDCARWWRTMAAHVWGDGPDPRAGRPDFVPYARPS